MLQTLLVLQNIIHLLFEWIELSHIMLYYICSDCYVHLRNALNNEREKIEKTLLNRKENKKVKKYRKQRLMFH